MGLLDTIKSLLGLSGDDGRRRDDGEVGVTVERDTRETGEPQTETDATGSVNDEGVADETAEPAEIVDTAVAAMQKTRAVEAVETTDSDAEDGAEETAADTEETDARADSGASESPEVLKGIGPTYARRLSDAGIDTVADLAAAEAADVAAAIDVSEKRVSRWIDRANDY